jgi:hypothetical protein
MAVFKSSAEVLDVSERAIGAGMAYIHLRLAAEHAQQSTGTISLRHWEPLDDLPTSLRLADGRRLSIVVSRELVSACSQNHILRFQASWPPTEGPADSSANVAPES